MSEDHQLNKNDSIPMGNSAETTVWEVEVWKRAEQTKFKAYLKQLEFEYTSKFQEELLKKEEDREKEFKAKMNELTLLQNRLRKKTSELESRENKIILCEEQLKLRVNEVSKQLMNKDEEITYLKNKFKEEKAQLEKQKTSLSKSLNEKQKKLNDLEEAFKQYKKDIEDSPLSLLKNEISKKQIQYEELLKEKNRINSELERSYQVNDKLKNDLIKMKKAFEQEKENLYKQRVDEVEKLKFEIYNQKSTHDEMDELKELREKFKKLSGEKINESVNPNGSSVNMGGTMMAQSGTIKKDYKIITIHKRGAKPEEGNYKNQIERLTNERNMLLSEGLYTESDPLIIQLDSKIRKLLQNSGNY